jgi:uncharacterized metal-binding protein YceD (DUF177 family)
VAESEFVVPLADLESGPKHLESAISEAWLKHAFEDTDATAVGPGRLDVELSKNGRDVLVRGRAEVDVTVPCVVTLDPLPFKLRAEILLLLAPGPGEASGGRRHGKAPPASAAKEKQANKPAGKKGKRSKPWSEEPELSASEAAADTFSGDEVVLDRFLREFILLELPMYPRRSDLPSPGEAAIAPGPEPEGPKPLDPRLSPLAELAKRLVSNEQKKE